MRTPHLIEFESPQLFLLERLQLHMNHCQGGYPPSFGGSHLRAFRTVVVTAVDTLLLTEFPPQLKSVAAHLVAQQISQNTG